MITDIRSESNLLTADRQTVSKTPNKTAKTPHEVFVKSTSRPNKQIPKDKVFAVGEVEAQKKNTVLAEGFATHMRAHSNHKRVRRECSVL